jgi:hypothetical protein
LEVRARLAEPNERGFHLHLTNPNQQLCDFRGLLSLEQQAETEGRKVCTATPPAWLGDNVSPRLSTAGALAVCDL